MTVQQFLEDDRHRRRYWAGSHLGWRRFTSVKPNAGHHALAAMEAAGQVSGVLTQNVDGLHRQAGSRRVVELHGAMGQVRCLDCGQLVARETVAARLAAANPWIDTASEVELAPDGDVAVGQLGDFVVPVCTVCGGTLNPDVVRSAGALLIAGSSLVVNSGIRLLDIAVKRRIPVVIVNRGPTRGDARATVRLEAGTSETLAALAGRL